MNHKRVERIWKRDGLKVPARQPKRARLWLNDGSCVRLRPTHKNHVWSYDFVHASTHDGRALKLLILIHEFTRECSSIDTSKRLDSEGVLCRFATLFVELGVPEHIRSDNGPEFTATAVREWLGRVGGMTLFIETGSPRENGYTESFNDKLRHERLNGESFSRCSKRAWSSSRGALNATNMGRTARSDIDLLRPRPRCHQRQPSLRFTCRRRQKIEAFDSHGNLYDHAPRCRAFSRSL